MVVSSREPEVLKWQESSLPRMLRNCLQRLVEISFLWKKEDPTARTPSQTFKSLNPSE